MKLTAAQARLIETIRTHGECAEYWPVLNDWVRDAGPHRSLALRNMIRTVDAVIRSGVVTLDDSGLFHLAEGDTDR